MDLIHFDKARAALAKSIDLNEVNEIRTKAEALRIYAGHATEMGRQCGIIRLSAERRLGTLLAKSVRAGNPQLSKTTTIGLEKLGITRDQSSKWQAAASLPAAKFDRYVSMAKEPSTAGVLRLVKEHQQEERREQAAAEGPKSGGNILSAPASTLWSKLADDSVTLFLTDPPYEQMERYEELAELAAAKLKPGCLALAYCGQNFLPAVLEAMSAHLAYHWIFSIRFGGPHRPVYAKNIQNTWQAVVSFSKGGPAAGWIVDGLESGGRSKELHDHGKNLSDLEYFVEKLSEPGDLIVDPFCGAGSVPSACKRLGRRWLACEVDSGTARAARKRVA